MSSFYKLFFLLVLLPHDQSFSQGKIVLNGATINVVNAAYIVTKDVSLTSASTLNITNSNIKIAGAITNSSGVFNVTTGTVEMNGASSQTIPANAFFTNKIKNLVVSNNVTLAGEDSITNALSFGSSNMNFATGGLLTIKSTLANTARVADITNAGLSSGNTITGNVRVERFVLIGRAWRFLTAPISVTGAQTIKAAWQEGQTGTSNNVPGFGIQITGGTMANGFDQGVNSNVALKEYIGGIWSATANTNATLATNQPGYMVFIRGDRNTILSQGLSAASSSTVVRSTGTLKTNNQSYAVAAAGFTVAANPYASAIDFHQITKTNVQDNLYLWDPKLTGSNGVGAFVNVSWNGTSYDITPSAGGSGLNQYIQSGSAFLAKTLNGTAAGTLIIKETDKVSTPNINAERGAGTGAARLKTNLYSINADTTISLVDGMLNSYAAMYSDSIDHYDAVKINNFAESLAGKRYGILLVTERKQPITYADTIFLNMLQMKVKSYRFEFIGNNFSNNGLTGFLEDSYFNTRTPLNLNDTTRFNFNVINIPGSWNPMRFRIVFMPAVALPVTFSTARAFAQNDNVKVEWTIENEINIKQYEVEKSADGKLFVKVNTVVAKGNGTSSNYNWLDESAFNGNNYYRIKSIYVNGETKYSIVMKVYMGKAKPEIVLQTNVITNNAIVILMNNMPKGTYAVSLSDNLGQILLTKKIEHAAGSSTESIQLNKNFAAGIYHLTIVEPDMGSLTMKLLVQ